MPDRCSFVRLSDEHDHETHSAAVKAVDKSFCGKTTIQERGATYVGVEGESELGCVTADASTGAACRAGATEWVETRTES